VINATFQTRSPPAIKDRSTQPVGGRSSMRCETL
jgi:hypothetical protein